MSEEELAAQKKKSLNKNSKMVSSIDSFETNNVDDVVQVNCEAYRRFVTAVLLTVYQIK